MHGSNELLFYDGICFTMDFVFKLQIKIKYATKARKSQKNKEQSILKCKE